MLKKKRFIDDVFRRGVRVCIGTFDEFSSLIERKHGASNEIESFRNCGGMCLGVEGVSYIWSKDIDKSTFVHELAHFTFNSLLGVGVNIEVGDRQSNETFCYFIGSYTNKIFNRLDKLDESKTREQGKQVRGKGRNLKELKKGNDNKG